MKQKNAFWEILKTTFKEWNNSPASRDSAGLAYYAMFSLPGLLIIIIWIAGLFLGDDNVRQELLTKMSEVIGKDSTENFTEMITNALADGKNFWMKTVGVLALIFGATTLFFNLQQSLNRVWGVRQASTETIKEYIKDRGLAFLLIVVIALLFLANLLAASLLSASNVWLEQHFGTSVTLAFSVVNFIISIGLITLLFMFIFKYMPDISISWRAVWVGALLTAIWFEIGKYLIGFYFEYSKPSSVFGAAGSLILVMIWMNYICQILFLGAVFTKVYAQHKNYEIKPSEGAEWIPQH
ncbi:YihY/virulence factor BrkB family protein [Riemerella columbina]|uniref:YihY/virulence factor BrkB family protein n=1 Tax=Riemerella columbina TaxID=103810 RepID=UPI00266EF1E1|nr:YihY/virulence factor BrkB family protein [Riemerella columbina]WKS94967.1 YihY/virulence factor BrkB family protein [Riemerella columbina]